MADSGAGAESLRERLLGNSLVRSAVRRYNQEGWGSENGKA